VSLSRVEVGTAGPGGTPGATLGKMPDERGLFLTVPPARGKSWRWRYSFNAKQRLRSSGTSGVRLTVGSGSPSVLLQLGANRVIQSANPDRFKHWDLRSRLSKVGRADDDPQPIP
jgi:hypothetical protein